MRHLHFHLAPKRILSTSWIFACWLIATLGFSAHNSQAQAQTDATSPSFQSALDQILKLGPKGQGNPQAVTAWKEVSKQPASAIPNLLGAMGKSEDIAGNYLRSAIETIVQRETSAGHPLPIAELGTFLFDTRNHPRARKLAFDLITQSTPGARNRILPAMLNDPSVELRYDAVQLLIQQATNSAALAPAESLLMYQQAISHARSVDQIEFLSARLKDAGHPVSLPSLFGWVQNWKVIGPFDNSKREGFERVYPPEQGPVNLTAEYDGKAGKVRWVDFTGKDEYGKIDINKPLGALKETIAYCHTELFSDKAQSVELRLGCKNSWKIWLNDQFLFGRDEYHRGAEIDQYRLKVDLKAGRNTLLVKVGQNEQKEEWTVEWEFQLRVTDALGTPIVLQQSKPAANQTAQR